ncbi:hypothetical protein MLD38_012062 [Melastoma candidum]|uniref:Uncharacterized protein n=1 Tax=Melastoma candidum TaxID=119954 RepID=A0ACB9R8N7_9MYRT|nr:hypothetical protein MLD38_012062 [Melastoma candidum]
MEERDDVKSMLLLLPLSVRSSRLCWPSSAAVEALQVLARGPEHSRVDSGEFMARFISHLRDSLSLSSTDYFATSATLGYALFFDELFPRKDSEDWFQNVVPSLASSLLRLPSLLEDHWQHADSFVPEKRGVVRTSLRVLDQQEAGVVLLSQELIAALLACSLFCLFPECLRVLQ